MTWQNKGDTGEQREGDGARRSTRRDITLGGFNKSQTSEYPGK